VYSQGQNVIVRIKITAPHGGRFSFGLCKVPGGTTTPEQERGVVTQKCFDDNNLEVVQDADGRAQMDPKTKRWYWWYGKLGSGEFPIKLKLPAGVTCDRCVIQWHWETGNSCQLPNTPPEFSLGANLSPCLGGGGSPEEFWNCADVKILPSNVPLPPQAVAQQKKAAAPAEKAKVNPAFAAFLKKSAADNRKRARETKDATLRAALEQQARSWEEMAAGGAGEGYTNYARVDNDHNEALYIVAIVGVAGMVLPLAVALAVTVGIIVWFVAAHRTERFARAWPLLPAIRPQFLVEDIPPLRGCNYIANNAYRRVRCPVYR
jgi:hypothetical protein